jgi:poly(A) polymerase
VALMDTLGVLTAVLPEGADPAALARLVTAGAPADPILRLAALLAGDAGALALRLRLAGAERERLVALRTGAPPHPGDDDAALRRLLADTRPDILIGRTWLRGGAGQGPGQDQDALRARLAAMPRPVFPLEGRDVLALGLPPGPEVGRLLRAVRTWWMAGGCIADAEACRAELARRAGR